ncbi:MAG: hypothetical protein ACXW4L_05910 [Candidatus Limnocylindrales bacterium]
MSDGAGRTPLPDLPPGTLAIGWATVELDRAAAELASLVGDAGFIDAVPSEILGARCRVGRAVGVGGEGLDIVLVEPDTEGRLAAFLARFGEGWVARWEVGSSSSARPLRPGPLGTERLADGADARGPFRLLVETATIAR